MVNVIGEVVSEKDSRFLFCTRGGDCVGILGLLLNVYCLLIMGLWKVHLQFWVIVFVQFLVLGS